VGFVGDRSPVLILALGLSLGGFVVGCGGSKPHRAAPLPLESTTTSPFPLVTSTSTTAPTTTTTTALAGFAGTVSPVTAADVPATWRPGCPIGPDQLSLLHLSYWGFDDQPHTGTMVVNRAVSADVLKIFSALYRDRFPILQIKPADVYRGSDPASMAADNTSGFNCRYAVVAGPPQWSAHAYGEAIDVNPVENPYILSGTVMPPAGAPYVNRASYRPGMAVPSGQLVQAFASAGWQWGGRWSDTPDYQHFSKTGA
jgi:hypothetical protein